MFNSVNLNKRGVTLDMTHPRGKEIFWRMVPAFDIVADNFSPHVMTNWGITLETLQRKRKDIILASISGYGRTGPLADYPANGATTEPMAGFASIHGYAGDAAMNTGGLIPDPISGYYFAAAVLTALFHRERSGAGQRIDESMLEAVAVQLGDAVLERDANGVVRRPQGNKHPRIAPHGVYATVNDEWIAIAAETDDAWQALVRHMGMAELVSDPRFASSSTRKHNEAALDEILSHWCRGQDAVQLETDLGERGISAARAAPFLDVYQNPAAQLRERGYMAEVEHPESGCHLMPAAPIIFARTGRPSLRPSPCFGEHSREVFAAELGMTDTEYDELEALGITGTARL
jgi:crotonobetainyl-CoA:carnitine CoA-transferase CaiB-like acyl-CoA transferase